MPKALRIRQVRARGPVATLVREDPLQNEDLLALRVIVNRELRVGLETHH
jgi:hypothetical protein